MTLVTRNAELDSPPPERIKIIGEYRLVLTQSTAFRNKKYIPVSWQWVRLTEINGAPIWDGIVRDEDVPLEVVSQIENHRQFLAALRTAISDA